MQIHGDSFQDFGTTEIFLLKDTNELNERFKEVLNMIQEEIK